MSNITIKIKFVSFSNDVCVVNTTSHPITIQDTDGTPITVPVSYVLDASVQEQSVSDLFVKSEFVGTDEGNATISLIEETFKREIGCGTLVIVGSMIAAQAYPGKVFAMTPAPGYERVPHAEKRMRCDKFTTFA